MYIRMYVVRNKYIKYGFGLVLLLLLLFLGDVKREMEK